jgi:hypothetical protein
MGQTSHQLFDKTITLKRKRPSTEYDRDYSTTTTTTTATTATASNSMHARTAADGRARDGQSTPTLCDAISFLSLSCLNQQQRKREQKQRSQDDGCDDQARDSSMSLLRRVYSSIK